MGARGKSKSIGAARKALRSFGGEYYKPGEAAPAAPCYGTNSAP